MIKQEVLIPNAGAEQVYDVLMQAEQHEKLIGDSVQIEDKVGTDFSTFSGYSTGTNLELKPGKYVKQTWRASDWPEGHFSVIEFKLSDTDQGAKVEFTQDNLPKGTQKEFESGWEDNYWQPLRKLLG